MLNLVVRKVGGRLKKLNTQLPVGSVDQAKQKEGHLHIQL